MDRIIKTVVLIGVVSAIIGDIAEVVHAQEMPQMIEHVQIIGVKRIEGRTEGSFSYLDLTVALANTNDEPLKLRNRDLEFFLGVATRAAPGSVVKDRGKSLGVDKVSDEVLLEMEKSVAGEDPEGLNEVTFKVNLGHNEAIACDLLSYVLNCLGNPSAQAPILSVIGRAEVGRYLSAQNKWDFRAGRIEWELVPRVQPGFLWYYGQTP